MTDKLRTGLINRIGKRKCNKKRFENLRHVILLRKKLIFLLKIVPKISTPLN